MKKLSKSNIIIIVVCCIVAFLTLAVCEYYFGHNPSNWNKISTNVFEIPDLKQGFIPQGLCFDEMQEKYFVSGYMKDGSPSRIYVIDNQTNQKKYFTLSSQDFESGHFGGISTHGDFVFVASDKHVLTLSANDIANVKNGEKVQVQNSLLTPTGADFCFAQNDGLWVGEFYRAKKYETDPTHYVEISEKETNHSVAIFYPYDNLAQSGLSAVATKALSIPDQVQGMSVLPDGRIVLSSSWSLADSKIYIFGTERSQENTTLALGETQVPMEVLSKQDIQKTIVAPCMAEGIVCKDNNLQILFESACNKYKFFTRNRIRHVQSIKID